MSTFETLMEAFAFMFCDHRSFRNFKVLMEGVMLNRGYQSVSSICQSYLGKSCRSYSSCQKFFSRARWSVWDLFKTLATLVISALPSDNPVVLCADDTITRRRGKKVFGKSIYRDPLGTVGKRIGYCLGIKWVFIGVLVRIPLTVRPWAIPVMALLCRPRAKSSCRKPRTHVRILMAGLRILTGWFPEREFILTSDGGYNSHELCRFVRRHGRITLVSRFHRDAILHAPPIKKHKRGRPPKVGLRLPSPQQAADQTGSGFRIFSTETFCWYGDRTRKLEFIDDVGLWRRVGKSVVPVRWVWVRDPLGKMKDQCFFSTDPAMRPETIIQLFVGRWSIEVVFHELKRLMNLESTMNWSEKSVKRLVPFIMTAYALVCLAFMAESGSETTAAGEVAETPSFSIALSSIRAGLIRRRIFSIPQVSPGVLKIPKAISERLISLGARVA